LKKILNPEFFYILLKHRIRFKSKDKASRIISSAIKFFTITKEKTEKKSHLLKKSKYENSQFFGKVVLLPQIIEFLSIVALYLD